MKLFNRGTLPERTLVTLFVTDSGSETEQEKTQVALVAALGRLTDRHQFRIIDGSFVVNFEQPGGWKLLGATLAVLLSAVLAGRNGGDPNVLHSWARHFGKKLAKDGLKNPPSAVTKVATYEDWLPDDKTFRVKVSVLLKTLSD
jgi:hypothetical protein